MGELEIDFPGWTRAKLERVAAEHAIEVALSRDGMPSQAQDDRLVVNMLRHEFTNYDNDPNQEAHRRVCAAIAEQYGWLHAECQRQIHARARQEESERSAFEYLQAQADAESRWRRERSAQSREAIPTFTVGMAVAATVKGHRRDATVTKVGRSRISVSFQIKSGAERTALLYARDVHSA